MDILNSVIEWSGCRVISGPFSSMELDTSAISWGDGDVIRKLLGVYEEELHESLEQVIFSNPKRVINLGCAEGYYAVGMSIRVPNAEVMAVDISQKALDCTIKNSLLNKKSVTTSNNLPTPKNEDFWIIDIEGSEFQVLSNPKIWHGVELIVEMHEWTNRKMKDVFLSLFSDSHKIKILEQGSRNPNKFNFLSCFPDQVRWAAMSESRPEMMRWMHLKPT